MWGKILPYLWDVNPYKDNDNDNDNDNGNNDDDDGYSCNKCQEPLEEACATRPNPPRNTKDTQTVIMMITTKSWSWL